MRIIGRFKNINGQRGFPRLFASIFLTLLILSACATVSVEDKKGADFQYQIGISYLNEGNYQAAFVILQKALNADPYNKEILNALGLVYLHLEDYENAKKMLIRALDIDDNFSDAHNNLGVVYIRKEQWGKAVESFKKAVANPFYKAPERAYYNLGMAYYRIKQFDPAVAALRDSLKRTTSFHLPYYGLSLVYNKMGNNKDAVSSLTRAIELDHFYKGDRAKFIKDAKERLSSAKGMEGADLADYLMILKIN
ncbi:MAG: tetratricopeptide repeat protein [Nitrospirae bacterium]|nr:tetratricopeptide repeat protein [Nitrospirota bacterium]